ncbi:hypothetical protein NA57DRAFT_80411 [Rhizodiscina lignyota]|uniref:RING-type domain-containing protein n=1 Tax=Rhizodiscina lignyota TaxID=1504668 RepID=A0A9P4I7L0_9PEZI|nr:hypothetical protein NA57DRAFT_80411 [Rhizodiscina lignyota]
MAEVELPSSDVVEMASDSGSAEPDAELEYNQAHIPLPGGEEFDDIFFPRGLDNAFMNQRNPIPDDLWEMFEHRLVRTPTPQNQIPFQRAPMPLPRSSPTPQSPPTEEQAEMGLLPGSTYDTPIDLEDIDYTPVLTEESCLQQVLQVLPEISHQHVRDLYNEAPPAPFEGAEWLAAFIGNIVESGKYPTEREAQKGVKRKRDAELFNESVEEQDTAGKEYSDVALQLLSQEFPDLIQKHIKSRLATLVTLYKTYAVLEVDNQNDTFKLRGKSRRKRTKIDESDLSPTPSPTMSRRPGLLSELAGFERASKELQAARKRRDQEAAKKQEADAVARAEEENIRKAQKENLMQECGCCYGDHPLNRMIACNNRDVESIHWLCYGCVKTYVETEIGLSRHNVVCFHVDGCTASFRLSQLRLAVPLPTLERLEKLQQQDDIRLAKEGGGLEGLEECPFCDFKADMEVPKDEDREFRCQTDGCGIVSCRFCKLETHVPLSCEEAAKDRGINARHQVEEAMTEALVRSCNKCKNKFIKEFGCNKMTCTVCHNIQCYVCSQNVTDYNHFADGGLYGGPTTQRRKCPLNDDVNIRHENEVKMAEEEALKKVREEHPDLTEEELKIKVSDEVKAAERGRRNMFAGGHPLGAYANVVLGQGAPFLFADVHAPGPHRPPPLPPNAGEIRVMHRAPPEHRWAMQAVGQQAAPQRPHRNGHGPPPPRPVPYHGPPPPMNDFPQRDFDYQLALLDANQRRQQQLAEQQALFRNELDRPAFGVVREQQQLEQEVQHLERLQQGRQARQHLLQQAQQHAHQAVQQAHQQAQQAHQQAQQAHQQAQQAQQRAAQHQEMQFPQFNYAPMAAPAYVPGVGYHIRGAADAAGAPPRPYPGIPAYGNQAHSARIPVRFAPPPAINRNGTVNRDAWLEDDAWLKDLEDFE